ncbi:hypothetical protein GPALN_005246 [Globodera pallida]|nr:hypothetical protein GPALN_005246 [Globodera pallida]
MNRDFIRRTYRKYMLYGYRFDESARPEECSGKDKATRFYNKQHVQRSGRGENPEMKPLDLVAMFGIFCLFSIGSLLSILAFCIESSYYNKQQQLIYRQKLRIVLLGPVLAFPLAISGLAKQLDQRANTVEGGWRNTVESRRPTMTDWEHEVSTEIGGF